MQKKQPLFWQGSLVRFDGNILKIELVNEVPVEYNLIDKQNGYSIYRKDEKIGENNHHHYLGAKDIDLCKNLVYI